jgi:glycosyltransferase involved in cell wall biosynthesis
VYSKDLIRNVQEDKRLEFCGIFENAKIPVILDGLDALVIPSMWHENMPLVSLSAQAAGCPLIASDIGGLSDIVTHERNGLLFKPGTAGQLRDRILRLLTDADLLKHLSDAAITPLNIDQYVDALEVEYRQAIGEAQ